MTGRKKKWPWQRSRRKSICNAPTSLLTMPSHGDRKVTDETTTECSAPVPQRTVPLPALASTLYNLERHGWSPTLMTVLAGVNDRASPLHALLGQEDTMIRHIYGFLTSKWADGVLQLKPPKFRSGTPLRRYRDALDLRRFHQHQVWMDFPRRDLSEEGDDGLLGFDSDKYDNFVSLPSLDDKAAFVSIKTLPEFPEPRDIHINMMPFIFGKAESLGDYQQYYSLIELCPYLEDEIGSVGYLTIHESHVDASQSQRKQGIHIAAPGICSDEETGYHKILDSPFTWGGGYHSHIRLEGGIFMASSVADTSKVWDAWVDKKADGIVGHQDGGCDHLRPLLGKSQKLGARELVWMTDATPHEWLPQKESGYCQFFQVVVSNISHWDADHLTPNPLVPLPDHVVVVHGNKAEI